MPASVQSLQRAFNILYFVAGRTEGSTIAEIATGTGLKRITTYKLLRTLEAEQFIQRLPNPLRFTIGHAIHELKHLDDARAWLTEAGKALLQAQREFPEVNFVIFQYHEGSTFERLAVKSQNFGRLIHHRDQQVHPYEKAGSLLFLAHCSEEESRLFHELHPFERGGEAYWGCREKLEEFLEGIRRSGYSQPDFPGSPYYRVAVPVWSPDGTVLAAVGGFIEKSDITRALKRQILQECKKVANAIMAMLPGLAMKSLEGLRLRHEVRASMRMGL